MRELPEKLAHGTPQQKVADHTAQKESQKRSSTKLVLLFLKNTGETRHQVPGTILGKPRKRMVKGRQGRRTAQ